MTATTAAIPVGSVIPPAAAATSASAAATNAATEPISTHIRGAGDGPLVVGVCALPVAVTRQRWRRMPPHALRCFRMSAETPDYVRINRDAWTKSNARYADGRAEEAWAQPEISWGVWDTPESAVNVLPDVKGKDVVELGCGTAYVGAWLKRLG